MPQRSGGRMTKFLHSFSLPSLPSCKTSLSGFATTGHHRLELEPIRGPVSWKALEQKETKPPRKDEAKPLGSNKKKVIYFVRWVGGGQYMRFIDILAANDRRNCHL